MKKYIDKTVIENILHKLWKKDTGFENIDIAQIAYNRALQDVQCEIDTIEVQEDSVSEELEKEIDSYFAKWLQGASDEGCFNSDSQLVSIYDCHRIAHHFAKWQKEQMMAKTIDATCFGFQDAALFSFRLPAGSYLVGSKVKVLVIEEE